MIYIQASLILQSPCLDVFIRVDPFIIAMLIIRTLTTLIVILLVQCFFPMTAFADDVSQSTPPLMVAPDAEGTAPPRPNPALGPARETRLPTTSNPYAPKASKAEAKASEPEIRAQEAEFLAEELEQIKEQFYDDARDNREKKEAIMREYQQRKALDSPSRMNPISEKRKAIIKEQQQRTEPDEPSRMGSISDKKRAVIKDIQKRQKADGPSGVKSTSD